MLLYPCVNGLQQYGHLNKACPLCFLFSNLNKKIGNMNFGEGFVKPRKVGWLFVWGISVYIGPSPKEREKAERKNR